MNFQVTVLKILVSYPEGFASLEDLKRDMAILATSGQEWSERTKRLAARVPKLEIFSQGLVERLEAGWRITQRGRSVLTMMEAPVITEQSAAKAPPPGERVNAAGAELICEIFAGHERHFRNPQARPGPSKRCPIGHTPSVLVLAEIRHGIELKRRTIAFDRRPAGGDC
jgi:hypothetical protein